MEQGGWSAEGAEGREPGQDDDLHPKDTGGPRKGGRRTCLYLHCISLLTSAVEQEQITVRPGEMGAGNAVIPKLMAWRDPLGVCYP